MVKNTIAAETLTLLEGSENCFLLGSIIKEMLDVDNSSSVFPIRALTGNQSLCDAVHSTKTIEDKRLKIDIGILREMLHNQEISSIEWIDSDRQLTDPLTKGGASTNKLVEACTELDSENLLDERMDVLIVHRVTLTFILCESLLMKK